MPELVDDCPRCRARQITFDVTHAHLLYVKYSWQRWYEVYGVCRKCKRGTIFGVSQREIDYDEDIREKGLLKLPDALNRYVRVEGYISQKDEAGVALPEHLPPEIETVFREGATCLAVNCYNAAGTMFRLCVDMATRSLLPAEDSPGLNSKVQRDLGLRLPWLFDTNLLPAGLRDLSQCIREDGNDGAHVGSLSKADAEDLLDFTRSLLERLYTEPERLRLAKERRESRRAPPAAPDAAAS